LFEDLGKFVKSAWKSGLTFDSCVTREAGLIPSWKRRKFCKFPIREWELREDELDAELSPQVPEVLDHACHLKRGVCGSRPEETTDPFSVTRLAPPFRELSLDNDRVGLAVLLAG